MHANISLNFFDGTYVLLYRTYFFNTIVAISIKGHQVSVNAATLFSSEVNSATFSVTGFAERTGFEFDSATGVIRGSPNTFDVAQQTEMITVSRVDADGNTESVLFLIGVLAGPSWLPLLSARYIRTQTCMHLQLRNLFCPWLQS
jgi:hypothetical protein